MTTATLDDRALISVTGAEAEGFLQNLITTDLDVLAAGDAKPGALLSPQGKILFDFLISRDGDGFIVESRADIADDLVRRLMIYRLRAKVQIAKQDQVFVQISWGADSGSSRTESAEPSLRDARFPKATQVTRRYGPASPAGDRANWEAFRIASGIPESGADYALGDAFPHDVLLDQIGGLSFRKGCYVGQEVVSRMQHRGTARRRILIASSDEPMPAPGSDLLAGGRSVGLLGSTAGDKALAMVRIDKVKAAMDDGAAITAGDMAISLAIPHWATFTFPQAVAAEDA